MPDPAGRNTQARTSPRPPTLPQDSVVKDPSGQKYITEPVPDTPGTRHKADPIQAAGDHESPATQPTSPPEEIVPNAATTKEEIRISADRRSLADLLKDASPLPDEAPNSTPETQGDSLDDQASEKWQPVKPAVFNRVAEKLVEYRQADTNVLLAEAQKSDRNPPEVYVLLNLACERAVSTRNPAGAMQAIDLLESKFLGNYDQRRVDALRAILTGPNRHRSAVLSRNLANVALGASEKALAAGNKPLAERLGSIALQAAQHSGPPALQQRIRTYLRGL